MNKSAQQQIDAIAEACRRIKPLVAIQCITYNHEPYIRDALKGFVMQKTDFPFVAIVHDDASTDGTAAIIREFAEKYPDIIKPIYETENQYSKRDGSLSKIVRTALGTSGARYIAMCEGDDYWTDPLKLQKQVDFLESHTDYSMCFHKVEIKCVGTKDNINICNEVDSRDYSAREVFESWIIPTCSALLRSDVYRKRPLHPDFIVGDNILWATCCSNGKIWGMNDTMGVYRRISSGWTAKAYSSRESVCKISKKWINHYKAMAYCFPLIDKSIFDNLIVDKMTTVSRLDLLMLRKEFFNDFIHYYGEYGFYYAKSLLISIYSNMFSMQRVMNKVARIFKR